jgi:hypothetical protein
MTNKTIRLFGLLFLFTVTSLLSGTEQCTLKATQGLCENCCFYATHYCFSAGNCRMQDPTGYNDCIAACMWVYPEGVCDGTSC